MCEITIFYHVYASKRVWRLFWVLQYLGGWSLVTRLLLFLSPEHQWSGFIVKEDIDMDETGIFVQNPQGQRRPETEAYERPAVRELGTVEDLTWDSSLFEVST